MTNIIGIIKKSIILGCMLIFATANGDDVYWNKALDDGLQKNVKIERMLNGRMVVVKNWAFTSSPDTRKQCEIIIGIMNKVYRKLGSNEKTLFAKELAKVFLTNAQTKNYKYGFTPAELRKINTVQTTFFNHIRKHFSKESIKLAQEGKHSIVLRRAEGEPEELISDEIRTILNNIISNNTLVFSKMDNVLELRHLKPVSARVALQDTGKDFEVYSITGAPNTRFDPNERGNTIKFRDISQETHIKGLNIKKIEYKTDRNENNEPYDMFFQLHLCPLSPNAQAFGADDSSHSNNYEGTGRGGNGPSEGRYGTCFVRV